MDEADVLGDRIVIMSQGQLRCLGSSLFLKKEYGVGYLLTVEKPSGAVSGGKGDDLSKNLTDIVVGSVPKANLLTDVGTEISFQLPLGASSHFLAMFKKLDDEVDGGNIVTYGVGITTLDEVFLLVARGDSHEKKTSLAPPTAESKTVENEKTKADDERSVRSRLDLEDDGLFIRHLGALFRKRAANFKRDKKAWCCTTVLPSLFVLIGFLLYTYTGFQGDLEPLTLSFDDFNPGVDTVARNLVNFNSGNSFSCQPGNCIFQPESFFDPVTFEQFHFCGAQSQMGNTSQCSIESYESIIARISEGGAAPLGAEVANVSEVSNIVDSVILWIVGTHDA